MLEEQGGPVPSVSVRKPDFEATEFCRILHDLAETRMTVVRTKLTVLHTRGELDAEVLDVCTDKIVPLFNDENSKSGRISTFSGEQRKKISDIDSLDLPTCLHLSGQCDPDGVFYFTDGKSYLMYVLWLLKENPQLELLEKKEITF